MDHLDSERIILEVEQNPFLYDTRHEDFKNRDVRRNTWLTIAKNLVGEEEWGGMDKGSKSNIGKEVQKRWKSMKDSYVKYLKSMEGKSGITGKQKKPYLYHKQLTFLQTAFAQRQNSENIADEGQDDSTDNSEVNRESTFQKDATRVKCSSMPKKCKTDHFERDVFNILQANEQAASTRAQDPDEMFLLSQLPLIKQLSQHEKMDFQIKFLQLLQTYNKPPTT